MILQLCPEQVKTANRAPKRARMRVPCNNTVTTNQARSGGGGGSVGTGGGSLRDGFIGLIFFLAKGPRLWSLPFEWRHALQCEYLGLFALITTFFAVDIASDWFYLHQLEFDRLWLTVWLIELVMFAVVRFLRRRPRLLVVARR